MSEDVHIPSKNLDHARAQIDVLRKDLDALESELLCGTKAKQKLYLFNPVLDEEELAECLSGLYDYCAKSMKMPGQDEHDKVKFAAYLYYLTKGEGFKGDHFNQTRFYQFIQEKVFYGLKQTVRTFNSRVNSLSFLDKAVKHPTDYAKDLDFRYFQHLKSKFQKSDYFTSLKRLRSGLSTFL